MSKFNSERKFGVEIEFTCEEARAVVAQYMRESGITCYSESYNHTTKSTWKVITDSSCGFELVSPPLQGEEGLRQLKIACKALKKAGAKVNKRCGLHVHHEVNDFSVSEFANIFALYIKLEETIDTFVPESRRANNNTYCNSLALSRTQKQNTLAKLKEVKTINDITKIFKSRYLKVNAQSYVKYGTVEFRQHSGTIDYEKIYNWIVFTQRIVERAKEGKVQYSYKESTVKLLTLQKMLNMIPSSGADEQISKVNNFYIKRAAQLRAA